jgi:hypothetical protein
MPLNTDLNVAPFFDDFDANNQYYRVLFRPATALQARELNAVQSILQDQIEKFGNWAFKSGEIVSGCSITDDPILPFVRLQDFQTNSASFTIANFSNAQVVSATSNLTATVITSNNGLASNYPNTNVIYVRYLNTGNNGATSFSNNETLWFFTTPTTAPNSALANAIINTYSNSTTNTFTTGNAHGIHVDGGVVFINGEFVQVLTPTYGLVNNFGTYAGNNYVGFQLNEQIIDETLDSSLNDNALGYSNENAPGAWRIKLSPKLVSLDPATANTSGFSPIAVYNYGALVSKSTASSNVYSIIGDAIAQRIYDEAGNYVVNPFVVDTVTSVTANSVVPTLTANSVLGRVSPGVGYAQGQRVELQKTAYINMRRGVDLQTNLEQQITFNYGGYFQVQEVAGDFPFTTAQQINLYDTAQQAVTNRTFASTSPSGNLIGTAFARQFSLVSGTPGTNTAQYAVHVFNVQMNSGYNTNNIKSIYYSGGSKAVADLSVSGIQLPAGSDQLYSFGAQGLKNLRDSSNNIHTEYVYRTKASGTMNSNGDLVVTISSSAPGGTDILPYGIGQLTDLNAATFNLIATANVDSASLGTANVSSTTNVVTSSSASFLTTYNIGDLIKVGSDIRTVTSISNSTYLTVDAPFSVTNSAGNYYKSYVNGKIINISESISGPKGYVQVTNSTSFTINTSEIPSAGLSVDVVYNVLRTIALPAQKVINKNRFVKLDTTLSPNGPWNLGVVDIHRLRAVYGSSDGSYNLSNPNITSNFVFGTGQRDTHYGLGTLYPNPGYTTASNPYLLVELDYFTANTNSGVGFFTVESYPIDDANTANTNAIQTSHLPLYIDSLGTQIPLRDYVDFRTFANNTANNTGSCDVSNTTQVTAAISYATVNPSNTLTLQIPTNGLNFPSYGGNFQSDYTFYLPRNDLIMITPDNLLKVKEGVSSTSPQPPLYPDNAMVLGILHIPAYPSLSTDQSDQLLAINKTSKNLIRDTSQAISVQLVTNRRYTMKDIGTLDNRITNLEYYMSLSLLEKKATDMTVTDANGLNRFKNGIFVDPFTDFTNSDVSNPEYTIAIDQKNSTARPRIVREVVNIAFDNLYNTQNNVQQTGRAITIAYTEKPFLVQPYATQYRAAAHVSVAWNGKVVLIPSYDNHNDINNTGSINITVDTSTPWKQFAASPFGSIWGDWQTTSTAVSSTVYGLDYTGPGDYIPQVDLGYVNQGGAIFSQGVANQFALQEIQAMYGTTVNVGQFSIVHSDKRLKKDISIIGKLLNGLNLYKFRYLWSNVFYVGILAQEALSIIPDAVTSDSNGYMMVNYGKVGTPFMPYDEWVNTKNR